MTGRIIRSGSGRAGGRRASARFSLGASIAALSLAAAAPQAGADILDNAHLHGLLDVSAAPNNTAIGLNQMNAGTTNFDAYSLRLFFEGKPVDELEVFTQVLASDVAGLWVYSAYAMYTPDPERDLHIQAGKIPWPIGTYGPRTYSNKNPLVGTPLIYQYHTSLRSDLPAGSVDDLLANAGQGQFGVSYPPGPGGFRGMPIVYDRCWDVGAVVLGSMSPVEFSVGVTNGTPASAASGRDDNSGKSFMGRIGLAPTPGLRFGVSGSIGPYLPNTSESLLPTGSEAEDFNQEVLMADMEYLAGHVELRAEGAASTWETPFVGRPTVHGYYLEGKYMFSIGLWAAARWDELRFTQMQGTTGPARPWDDDVRRFEGGLGYRVNRNLIAKAVYQTNTLDPGTTGSSSRRYDLMSASISVSF